MAENACPCCVYSWAAPAIRGRRSLPRATAARRRPTGGERGSCDPPMLNQVRAPPMLNQVRAPPAACAAAQRTAAAWRPFFLWAALCTLTARRRELHTTGGPRAPGRPAHQAVRAGLSGRARPAAPGQRARSCCIGSSAFQLSHPASPFTRAPRRALPPGISPKALPRRCVAPHMPSCSPRLLKARENPCASAQGQRHWGKRTPHPFPAFWPPGTAH